MESRGRNYRITVDGNTEGTGIELAKPADMSRDPSSDPNIATRMIGYDGYEGGNTYKDAHSCT
jgi:hypothetical protein